MNEERILLSEREYEKLKAELEYLKRDRRREVADRIRRARSYGDLAENSEYDAAKEEQALLEKRISERQSLLKRAVIISPESVDEEEVSVGSEVTILDEATGHEYTYHIVGALDANPSEKRISYRSPVGKALFGKREGDTVQVRLPGGVARYSIVKNRWVGSPVSSEQKR